MCELIAGVPSLTNQSTKCWWFKLSKLLLRQAAWAVPRTDVSPQHPPCTWEPNKRCQGGHNVVGPPLPVPAGEGTDSTVMPGPVSLL